MTEGDLLARVTFARDEDTKLIEQLTHELEEAKRALELERQRNHELELELARVRMRQRPRKGKR